MKKSNFVALVLGTVSGVLFALGMCMAMISEWNAFKPGIVMGIIGAVILLAMVFVRRKMTGAPAIKLNGKTVGIVIYGIVGALVLGVGMCMAMVWEGLMIWGIVVGIVGIVLLLGLIPMIKGIH